MINIYHPNPTSGIEEVIARRSKGDLRPVVVYGFDSLDRIKRRKGGSIFETKGIYYLQLPAKSIEINNILQKAVSLIVPSERLVIDEKVHLNMIQKIRKFKHTCDNVWMSISANSNRAKVELESSPDRLPKVLSEVKAERIEKLLEEYKEIQTIALDIGIKDADLVKRLMLDTIEMIRRIKGDMVSPGNAVDLSFECVAKIRAIADIFGEAKELKYSD